MKKLIAILSLSLLTPAVFSFNIPDLKDTGADISKKIESHKPATESLKYNYTPVVFELVTDYQRNLYSVVGYDEYGREMRSNMNYKQDGLWGPGAGEFKAKCYATLLNKDYVLTHKDCIYKDRIDEIVGLEPGSYATFDRKGMTFTLNGRYLYLNEDTDVESHIDYKSGAALVKISDLCFQTKATQASNICVNLWESIVGGDNVTFDIKDNYGTYILSNINTEDTNNTKVQEAFMKRTFFSPVTGQKTIKSVNNGFVTVDGKEKSGYLAEPLFHRATSNTNILVGIRKTSDKYASDFTKTNNYALFSSEFTRKFKENVKTKGIKLVKDLNAERGL